MRPLCLSVQLDDSNHFSVFDVKQEIILPCLDWINLSSIVLTTLSHHGSGTASDCDNMSRSVCAVCKRLELGILDVAKLPWHRYNSITLSHGGTTLRVEPTNVLKLRHSRIVLRPEY